MIIIMIVGKQINKIKQTPVQKYVKTRCAKGIDREQEQQQQRQANEGQDRPWQAGASQGNLALKVRPSPSRTWQASVSEKRLRQGESRPGQANAGESRPGQAMQAGYRAQRRREVVKPPKAGLGQPHKRLDTNPQFCNNKLTSNPFPLRPPLATRRAELGRDFSPPCIVEMFV